MDTIPIFLFWFIALWGLLSRQERFLYIFFWSMAFGSFAVLPPQATGGLTLTPTPMIALMIIARQYANKVGLERVLAMIVRPSQLSLLFLFWLVSCFVTLFMPRFFAGSITVIPLSLTASTFGNPLVATTQNISQLAYISISVGLVFAFSSLLRNPQNRQRAITGIIIGGAVVVFTGILDYMTQFASLSSVLEPFRTATYALITEARIAGGKRVVGLMPEASSYGGLALTFLSTIYFMRRSLTNEVLRVKITPPLMLMLLLMVWLSTSSSAYVGFAVLSVLAVMDWMRRFLYEKNKRQRDALVFEFWIITTVIAVSCIIFLFNPRLLDPITNTVNTLIFQKTETSSFVERSYWTATSWKALLDSYGLGVGLGATRASNGLVAILSNTGFLGGILYISFLTQTFLLRRAAQGDKVGAAMISGLRWAFVPPFTGSILAGTTADFGVFNSFLFGLALAIEQAPPKRRRLYSASQLSDMAQQTPPEYAATTSNGEGPNN